VTAVGDVIPAGTTIPDDVTAVAVVTETYRCHPWRRRTAGRWENTGTGETVPTTYAMRAQARGPLTVVETTATRYRLGDTIEDGYTEPARGYIVGTVDTHGRPQRLWAHLDDTEPAGWVDHEGVWHTWEEVSAAADVRVLYAPDTLAQVTS
jgi:hypothetical protein